MMSAAPWLAELDTSALGGQGFSLWQALGGLVLVFGLLLVALRLLGRFSQARQHDQTALLAVWSLGPRREIQVLKLQDQVHYIYRHDGAMVLLKEQSLDDWQREAASRRDTQSAAQRGLARLLGGRDTGRGFFKSFLPLKP